MRTYRYALSRPKGALHAAEAGALVALCGESVGSSAPDHPSPHLCARCEKRVSALSPIPDSLAYFRGAIETKRKFATNGATLPQA